MMDAQGVVGLSDRVCQRAVKCRVGRLAHNRTEPEYYCASSRRSRGGEACASRKNDELGGKETRGRINVLRHKHRDKVAWGTKKIKRESEGKRRVVLRRAYINLKLG